jgi:hypothetical protein
MRCLLPPLLVSLLPIFVALLPACSIPNASHCGNRDGDATCSEQAKVRPHCSICVADNNGCIAEQPEDNCLATTTAASSSSTVDPPTSSTVDPPTSSTVDPPTSSTVDPPTSSTVDPTTNPIETTTTGQTDTSIGTTSSPNTTTTGDTTSGDTSTGEGTSTTDLCMGKMGPAPVELGMEDDLDSPGAYVVLAKTAITNVPGTEITGGNVGVSPAAAGSITGFALVIDMTGVFATSPAVIAPGKVYAADYAGPTPAHLTTAVLGMQAAYTDAASRVPTDYLDLESGDLAGLILAPGIYTWGTTVFIPDDVTLEGCEDDVWIFQLASDLDVSVGKKVILAGGAQAHNVFWQIAGQAVVHSGAHLEGVVLAKTSITFQTNASLNGRALAQTMIVLDKNAVTGP